MQLKIGESAWIEKERPKCGPLDAICRPLAVAICTSDVHTLWEGAIGDRHNMILGHECCAEVVEVGELVKDFQPGDRVLVPAITPDWNSLEAQAGYSMHSGGMLAGWKFSNFKDGVFSDYFHVNDADGKPGSASGEYQCGRRLHAFRYGSHRFPWCRAGRCAVRRHGSRDRNRPGRPDVRSRRQHARSSQNHRCRKQTGLAVEAARKYGATDFVNYKNGPIFQQVLDMTDGKGVDKVIIAGGGVETFAEAVKCLKPGGKIGNVNYLGSGDNIDIPRVEWGVGMGHKQINGGLMPGGRLRMEKLGALVSAGKLDVSPLCTHVFEGWEHLEKALFLMRDKPRDLIKPIVKIAD